MIPTYIKYLTLCSRSMTDFEYHLKIYGLQNMKNKIPISIVITIVLDIILAKLFFKTTILILPYMIVSYSHRDN